MSKLIQQQIIAEARRIIEQPEHWCHGTFAVGARSRRLARGSARAHRHCALSALTLAARSCTHSKQDADRLVHSIVLGMAPAGSALHDAERYVWRINDSHGQAAVLDLFDTALALY